MPSIPVVVRSVIEVFGFVSSKGTGKISRIKLILRVILFIAEIFRIVSSSRDGRNIPVPFVVRVILFFAGFFRIVHVLLVVELILAVRIHGLSRVICSRLDVRELLVLCVDVIYAGSKRRSLLGK
jgi:hypothetical protein